MKSEVLHQFLDCIDTEIVGFEVGSVLVGRGVCTFNSISVKPRPALTRRLYLIVGHRTMGRSLSIGRGATDAAFEIRAALRRDLRPGWGKVRESV